MPFGVRAFYESSLKARGWKSGLARLLLHIPIVIAAVWIFLITLYLVPWFSTSRVKQKAVNLGAVSSPSLRGIEYGMTDSMGRNWSLKADTVTVRDRQYGNAVFTSFKDVVVSHARVFTKVGNPADFLDWAKGSDLWFLMGLVLAVPQDKNDADSAFGSRLVIEDLEVYGADDVKGPRLLLSAEKMTRESVSDEIEFTGRLSIEWDPAKRITCLQTARWLSAQKMMHFPEGCLVNGKNRGMKYWVAGGNTGNGPKQFIAGQSAPHVQSAGLSSPSGDRIGPQVIQKLIKKKDPKSLQNILQYLVLNPKAFKDGGISPMMILCPNFKLGQFTPGPSARDAN
jgi:hypothetical protein